MPLSTGETLGPYRILDKLGEGGMGQVYRARDTKLQRDVAIKVLPDAFVADPERLARFDREAQALAALNHPNIAQIYGVIDEPAALVMEFVPGRTLDEVVRSRFEAGGPKLDVVEAIAIARAIAEGLEAAHGAGIVHRDLKPANVKVTADGTVKVLDFGLARMGADGRAEDARGATAANSPTMTSPATALGVILGTAAYMSPEQARGRVVDRRADIWAFGCVLYELLAGAPAFGGSTVTDVLAAVVTKEPDWTRLPADTPRRIRTLLERCLRKDPKQRLHDIADARIEIDSADEPAAAGPAGRPARSLGALAAVGVVALAAGVAMGVAWRATRETPPAEWTAARVGGPSLAMRPRLSPDGHLLAFVTVVDGQSQVAVMKPGTGTWTVLTRDRAHGLVFTLAWSTDGSQIYYDRLTDAPNGIYSVPALGGEERLVIENAEVPAPLPDGSILFDRLNADRAFQLHRFWPASGKLEPLPFVSSVSEQLRTRTIDGNRVVVTGRALNGEARESLQVLDLTTHEAYPISGAHVDDLAALTVDRRDGTVVAAVRDGSAFRVMRIGTDRTAKATFLFSVLLRPSLEVAPDGSLYVGLEDRPFEILRFTQAGGAVERLAADQTMLRGFAPLPDGRALVTSRIGSGPRVLVIAPGKEPVRLVQTDESTSYPVTAIAGGRAALLVGSGSALDIGVVAVDTGRILKRLKSPGDITCIGASPDGATIYASANGTIFAISIDTGDTRKVAAGDSFTVDPDSGDLVIKLNEITGFRLVRLPAAGGQPAPISFTSDLNLIPNPLVAGAIRQGRLVLPVGSKDSWYWYVAVLDLATGKLQKVNVDYDTDFHYAAWDPDGRIIAYGLGTNGAIWKFSPQAR